MKKLTITVHFKHTLADKVKNLFRPKAKRFPAVVTFAGFDDANYQSNGLVVTWGNTDYYYPLHTIKRVKVQVTE